VFYQCGKDRAFPPTLFQAQFGFSLAILSFDFPCVFLKFHGQLKVIHSAHHAFTVLTVNSWCNIVAACPLHIENAM
jgi:hypothetical protein